MSESERKSKTTFLVCLPSNISEKKEIDDNVLKIFHLIYFDSKVKNHLKSHWEIRWWSLSDIIFSSAHRSTPCSTCFVRRRQCFQLSKRRGEEIMLREAKTKYLKMKEKLLFIFERATSRRNRMTDIFSPFYMPLHTNWGLYRSSIHIEFRNNL